MPDKRFTPLLASILLGLVLGVLSLTMAMLTSVRAEGTGDDITISKGPAQQKIASGSTANFTIQVSNNSGVTITDVTVSDPLAPNCERPIDDLEAGGSFSYDCSSPPVTADLTNRATVNGFKLVGTGSTPVSDTDEAFVDVLPTIGVSKTANPTGVPEPGGSINFSVRVDNTSAEEVTLTSLVDDKHGNLHGKGTCSLPQNIAAGGYYECAFNATVSGNAGDSETDTVTATASDDENNAVQASANATVIITDVLPGVRVTKSADPTVVRPGDAVDFTIQVDNRSVEPVTLIGLDDTVFGDLATECGLPVSITLGGFFECVINDTVSFDHTNIVTATVQDDEGNQATGSDDASVNVIEPTIAIIKTPDEQIVTSGSTATFTVAVTNTGDAPLTNVIVSDPLAPGCDLGPVTLDIDHGVSKTCAVGPVTDGFINSAMVTGTTEVGTVTNADAAKVILAEALSCPADMIAYLRLNESVGPPYDDFYNGHDGMCDGACPSSDPGYIDGGQAFNGSDSGISVPPVPGDDSFDWGANDSFSIEFWMNKGSACSGSKTSNNEVIVGRVGNGVHWWVGVNCQLYDGQGKLKFYLSESGPTGGKKVLSNKIVTDGAWHHVVAVREKGASADMIRIYVDGQEENSTSASYSVGFGSPTAALNIGHFQSRFNFEGTLDEVALYDRALSVAEVQQHYYEGVWADRWYCEAGSLAPLIFSTPVTEAAVQRPYTYDVDAIGRPVPTYTLTISPTGMSIDPATGLISWKPVVTQQGSHPVGVEAVNSQGTDTQSFTIEVAEGPVCPAAMISYWKLEEDDPSGTTYADFYDGNDGACSGGDFCPAPSTGRVGGGQTFDGGDEIYVPDDAAFDWGADDRFSIEFWMRRPGTIAANEVIVGRQGPTHPEPHIWVGVKAAGNVANFCLYENVATWACVPGSTVVTDGDWHHIVAVKEAEPDRILLYVDGQQDASPVYKNYTVGFNTTTALNIGWLNLGAGFHFSGTVDEIALYNRALDVTEIQHHYNRGLEGGGYCVDSQVAIAKTANPTMIYAGATVTYTYTATNPGDDPLSSVSLSDDRCSSVDFVGGDDDGDDELDRDETWTYTCSMILGTDTPNTATVIGTDSLGDTVSKTATAFVDVINPGVAIAKTANPTTVYAGATVTYTYTVSNLGDDPLSNVSVSDDRCGPVNLVEGNDELDPVETWTYVCSTILFADTTNTAVVTAIDSLGGTVSGNTTTFVDVINPDIVIGKQANLAMVQAGATVTYTYTVINPGDDPLSSVSVSDDHCSPVTRVQGDEDLNPDEAWTYMCSMALYTDTTNIATVTGIDSLGSIVSDTATAFVDVSDYQIYLPIILNNK